MSRRFGRNQKRAMRADIKSAESRERAQKMLKLEALSLVKSTSEKIYELEKAIEHTRQVLGEFFVTLPPITKQVRVGVDVFDMPVTEPARAYYPYGADVPELTSQLARFEQLEVMGHQIERIAELRGMMHLRIKNGAGLMSYAFNQHSFRGFRREKVADIITRSIYRYLLDNPVILDRLGVVR